MKTTQHQKIMNYIRENGSITTLEASDKLRITKLTTRISELRSHGVDIIGIHESYKNESGEVSHYNRYFFGDNAPKQEQKAVAV